MNLAGLWDQLVDAVCRPPRDDGYTEADLVGGRRASFRLYERRYYRQDVTLENSRGLKLQCSHYRPCVVTSSDGRLPCVVYCHCNSGSRRDAEEILYHLLPKGITVFAFDFSGSGISEGSYVTLGAFEVDDLATIVRYLREEGSSSTIGLWGRSMGAVTALLYSQQDPSIAGMVLDSPFSRLVDLMMELAVDQQLRVPKPLLKMALAMLKRSVRKRAGFSVDTVAPLDCVGNAFIPALFGHATDDTFVNKHHSERLFQAYAGDKNFVSFDGDHNSVRPNFFYDSALIFLVQCLQVEELAAQLALQEMPQDALPHLHPSQNSIYVTASRELSGALDSEAASTGADARASSGIGSTDLSGGVSGTGDDISSRAGSPPLSSPHAVPRPPSGESHQMQRQLSPPWELTSRSIQPGRRSGAQAGAPQQQQQQQQWIGHMDGQHTLRAGQGQVQLPAAGLAAELGAMHLSEEEALQLAVEASLLDARQKQQLQQDGQGRHSGGVAQPVSRNDELDEQAMLEAAIAASLQPDTGSATGQAAAEGDGETAESVTVPAASRLAPQPLTSTAKASVDAEWRYPSGFPPHQSNSTATTEECTSGAAAQTAAGAHAGQEAGAVRSASLQLQRALSNAADGVLPGGAAAFPDKREGR